MRFVLYIIFVLAYLGFILFFLTLKPENPAVTLSLISFAAGGMVIMAIYTMTLYLFRRKEKALLYFALLCVSAGVRFFVLDGSQIIGSLIPGIPDGVIFAVRFTAINFFIVGIGGFMLEIFAPSGNRRKLYQLLRLITFITFVAVSVNVFIAGEYEFPVRFMSMMPTVSLQALMLFVIVKSPLFRENRLARMYFGATLVYVTEAVIVVFLIELKNVPVVSTTLFVIVHTILLSDRYSRAIGEKEMLDRLNGAKTRFLQDMSHEMKAPLTVIAACVDFADRQVKRENGDLSEAANALSSAREETQRLGRMIGGMVELISMNEVSENRRRVNFARLLQNSAEAFRLTLGERGNILTVEIAENLPDVFVENDRFLQVMANILSNAGKFAKTGTIAVTARLDGAFIAVRVTDTGEGVKPELLPDVWKRGVSGGGVTGYGLYVCKTVVEAHGGTINIESEPGAGTAVTFTVPVYGGQEAGHK